MRRAFLDTPEGQVHYATEGDGEPLLLLHQTSRSRDEFRELVPLLAKSRRLIAIDTIGFGDSYKPDGMPSIEDFARTAIRLLDTLGVEKTSILGIHTGSLTSVELAAAYPERVNKMVLYSPPYMDEEVGRAFRGAMPGLFGWKVEEDGSHLQHIWNFFQGRARDQGWGDVPPELVNRLVLDTLKCGEGYLEIGRTAVASYTNMADRLKMVQCPTLIVLGTNNLLELTTENKAMAGDLIPGSKVVEIEGGTFVIMNQIPERYAQLALEFLAN